MDLYSFRESAKSKPQLDLDNDGKPLTKISLSEFLESFGVECRRSNGESESLLAQLNMSGEIDAVISGD